MIEEVRDWMYVFTVVKLLGLGAVYLDQAMDRTFILAQSSLIQKIQVRKCTVYVSANLLARLSCAEDTNHGNMWAALGLSYSSSPAEPRI